MRILLAPALALALCAPASAGVIMNGDGLVCDTETGECCDPKAESCPAPGQSARSEPDALTGAALSLLDDLWLVIL